MKKYFLAILIVILAIGIASFIRLDSPSENSSSLESINVEGSSVNSIAPNNTGGSTTGSISNSKIVTLAELSKHNKKSDCWVGYSNKIYDITSFLPKHPGSAGAISPYCGTQDKFTEEFEDQHGKSKVSMLMKVGTLIGDFQIKGNL